jgi:hypothetical protein
MHTALRSLALSAVAALAVGFGISSSADAAPAAAAPTAKAATRYYSLMSKDDGRAVSVHQFYPTFTTSVAEAYDGTGRMQWGLVPRTGASDALLVNRLTGACLTASGGYAVLSACGSAATQGWSFVLPAGPDHIEAPYGLRNTATQSVLTVGPDNWGGTPMELKPDYGMAVQRFWVDWRYTG